MAGTEARTGAGRTADEIETAVPRTLRLRCAVIGTGEHRVLPTRVQAPATTGSSPPGEIPVSNLQDVPSTQPHQQHQEDPGQQHSDGVGDGLPDSGRKIT